ncbi:MAG: diguanylate cyclase [Coriobacteriales bacterium]|nr:diguanylate cyclase [Coriobacteriales bacterium]
MLVLGIVLSVLAVATIMLLFYENNHSKEVQQHHYECIEAADTLMDASDYLTSEVRMYVMTGRRSYAENYLREVFVDRRRDKALEVLAQDEHHRESLDALTAAFQESSALSETELYAMNLMANAKDADRIPTAVADMKLSAEDAALSADQKRERAQELVLGEEYQKSKDAIVANVSACTETLLNELQHEERAIDTLCTTLIVALTIIVLLFVTQLAHIVYANMTLIVNPLRGHVKSIGQEEPLEVTGAQELRQLAEAYNKMYQQNHRKTELLEHEAHTDGLTGLFNRGSYDRILAANHTDIVLVLIDIDNFKQINDTYGHEMGDKALKWVAKCIMDQFRTTDYTCRIGGDEFAIIMTRMRGVGRQIVAHKLGAITARLQDGDQDLPVITLSMGVASSDELEGGKNIYRAADEALYRAKEQGRNQVCFFGPEQPNEQASNGR